MYELRIKDTQGVWQIADMGDDLPAMTYQVNDIAQLDNRNGDYSQALKLPLTKKNKKMFGFADEFDVLTDIPYKRLDCRLYCDGYELAGKGAFIELRKVNEYFEVQILSGNVPFFDKLKEANFSDLDLGSYEINEASLKPTTWGDTYTLAYSRFSALSTFPFNESRTPIVKGAGAWYPFVKIPKIIEKIMEYNDYSFSTNINEYEDKALSLASVNDKNDGSISEECKGLFKGARAQAFEPGPVIRNVFWDIVNAGNNSYWKIYTNGSYNEPKWCVVESLISGDIHIDICTELGAWDGGMSNGTYFNIYKNEILFKQWISNYGFTGETYSTDVPCVRGDKIQIEVYGKYDLSTSNSRKVCIRINGLSKTKPSIVGSTLTLSECLGFKNQWEFMIEMAKIFGLTFAVDEVEKKVLAFSMGLLYDNITAGKEKVKDWSDKVHDGNEEEVSFSLSNYGQKNIIKFENNEQDNYTDLGFFNVNNESIPKEKELFSLKLQAGMDLDMSYYPVGDSSSTVASIPLYELGEANGSDESAILNNGLLNAKFLKIKPHIVSISKYTISFDPVEGTFYRYPEANHFTGQQIVDTAYSTLANKMLNKAKKLEMSFHLTPQDLEKFDHTIPVYIKKFGAYFYVNKIKNFVSGKPTACELIRL